MKNRLARLNGQVDERYSPMNTCWPAGLAPQRHGVVLTRRGPPMDATPGCLDTTLGCLTFCGTTFLGTLGGWIVGVLIGMQIDDKSFQPFQTGMAGGLIGAGVALAAALAAALAVAHRRMKGLVR